MTAKVFSRTAYHRLGPEAAWAEHPGAAPFELLEHPADIRLRPRGATLAEVFANAARGMMSYLFDDEFVESKPERWERIEITAPDCEALVDQGHIRRARRADRAALDARNRLCAPAQQKVTGHV